MKQMLIGLMAATLVSTAAVAKPAERPLGVEASIPFANSIGIRNFRAESNDVLMIEDNAGKWYRAEMFAPCTGLNFAEHIGFETRGTNSFDKFSQIVVEGRTCQVKSLVTAAKPLSKKEKKAQAEAADKANSTL
jgi:hypothetical protein